MARTLLINSSAGIYIPHAFAVKYGIPVNFDNWEAVKDDIEFLKQADAHEHEDYMEVWSHLEQTAILRNGGTSYLVWDEDLWAESQDADLVPRKMDSVQKKRFWRSLCDYAYHSFSDLDVSERDSASSDEFDFAEALYWYCKNNHSGQTSLEYLVLSNLQFRPSMRSTGVDKEDNIFYMYGYTDKDLEQFLSDWEDNILEWVMA